jgi:hypothetical protein
LKQTHPKSDKHKAEISKHKEIMILFSESQKKKKNTKSKNLTNIKKNTKPQTETALQPQSHKSSNLKHSFLNRKSSKSLKYIVSKQNEWRK